MKLNNIVDSLISTEKSFKDKERNVYHFKVVSSATKGSIAENIGRLFGVDVQDVRTMIFPGKEKRVFKSKANRKTRLGKWKKAIVTVKEGQEIKFMSEGK